MTNSKQTDCENSSSDALSMINVEVESEHNKSQTQKTTQIETSQNNSDQINKKQEFGGRGGLDPTRFGDWEKNGRCIDF